MDIYEYFGSRIWIGIDSSDQKYIDRDFTDCGNQHPFYSWGPGTKYSQNGEESHYGFAGDLGGLQIVMEINTKEKSFKISLDGTYEPIVFDEIDFDDDRLYKLAILLADEGDTITLSDFKWDLL